MRNQFINKKDSHFTEQETKDILNHLIEEYFDDETKNFKMTFEEMISSTAKDLGISKEQIYTAFSHPNAKKIITDLEFSHTQLLKANQNLIDHLNKPFAFKNDLKFSEQERKDILVHAQKNYFGKREYELRKFDDTIRGMANDLGLTNKQVRTALSSIDKNTFKQLELTHNERLKTHFETLKFIETVGYPKIIRVLRLTSVWKLLLKKKKTK